MAKAKSRSCNSPHRPNDVARSPNDAGPHSPMFFGNYLVTVDTAQNAHPGHSPLARNGVMCVRPRPHPGHST